MFGPRNLYTTIQRNKQSFYIGSALFLIICTFLYGPSFRTPYGLKEEKQSPSGTGSYDASRLTNGGYTRLITGVNGFYSFENVYVRDRTLYVIPDPNADPLPPIEQIISSQTSDEYSTDPVAFEEAPHLSVMEGNGDYPPVPRMRVLTAEEAREIIPGWGDDERYDGDIKVFQGTTIYLADDPAILGWGALMHHYYHWMAEVLLGSYHAYASALLSDPASSLTMTEEEMITSEISKSVEKRSASSFGGFYLLGETESDEPIPEAREYVFSDQARRLFEETRLPSPERFVIPFGTNWEGKELNEMVMRLPFGEAEVFSRNEWREFSKDRQWRMFEKVIITDRRAAHLDKNAPTEIWNKMALNEILDPLPTNRPNFFLDPQVRLAEALEFPPVPLIRNSAGRHGKSLAEGVVKVIYVDRQGGDRKLDETSSDNLLEVLRKLAEEGVSDGERKTEVMVEAAKFENVSPVGQLRAAYDADIWLGIHGNGLTHAVWTRPGATLIELFPVDSFIRDYEVVSYALGHRHIAVWNDRELTKKEWTATHGGLNPGKLHDGTEVGLDKEYIESLLREVIAGMIWD